MLYKLERGFSENTLSDTCIILWMSWIRMVLAPICKYIRGSLPIL